jgi:hypothetical protein
MFFNRVPPKRRILKAFLYAMAFWGYIHFFTSLVYAIGHRSISYLNPYTIIKFDGLLGSFGQKWWVAIIGWGFFFATVVIAYRLTKTD